MPKRTDIHSILVLGSGPIIIGQACEFDYSGTQGLKALKEEGYRVIVVNSNPATVMTDPDLVDATYIEPITPEFVTRIIDKERPDALIATLGGQTALNCALALHQNGILKKYDVELIGVNVESITLAEDRAQFQRKMAEIGIESSKTKNISSLNEVSMAVKELGLPLLVRSSYTLGGQGAGIAHSEAQVISMCEQLLAESSSQEITLDEVLVGWKEFELEVIRDKNDNCIVVCGVENVDPLGIHTGDSITVAPIQTLTDKEYQAMRNEAFKVLRAVKVETGGSNVQFAIDPKTGRRVVIEMNPRVSRSSALVSKATGFPIAKVAAKLAVGYTLDELSNDITGGVLPASFEPSIDYIVIKIPRFHDDKFMASSLPRGPQMRSIGEVMAIGRTFMESLQNAICSLDIGSHGFDDFHHMEDHALFELLKHSTGTHLWAVGEAIRRGNSIDKIHALTHIDPWFLKQIEKIIQSEKALENTTIKDLTSPLLKSLKRGGFSDQRIATLVGGSEQSIRQLREQYHLLPVYKRVDSCAGEFKSTTAYLYSTYEDFCESKPNDKAKVMIVGSGPNRIGQGSEFDYCCVQAINAFAKAGYETVMVNCNPETISTDYDVADRLYCVPLTFEKVYDIIQIEKPNAVALQFGGQTPLNLIHALSEQNVPLIGLTNDIFNQTEDRAQFRQLILDLGLKQPGNITVRNVEEGCNLANSLSFPIIMRPSFILGGKGMFVVSNPDVLKIKLKEIFADNKHPVLLEEFLEDAIEVDVDAIADGEDIFVPLLLEHIEKAGIHSGDSACIAPPYQLSRAIENGIYTQTKMIASALKLKGLINIQFAVKGEEIYIIEANPRASRTLPFICKTTGLSLIDIAVNCMLGKTLREQHCLERGKYPFYCVKEAVLPFKKFPSCIPLLGPEMKATGEVMGIGKTPQEAFAKAQIAAFNSIPDSGNIYFIGFDEKDSLFTECKIRLMEQGYQIHTTFNFDTKPDLLFILNEDIKIITYAIKQNIPYASTREAAKMMIEYLFEHNKKSFSVRSLLELYHLVSHPSKTKHLLTGEELLLKDMNKILELAIKIKKHPKKYAKSLTGKKLVMLFDKPSFRTRLSFSSAMQELGGDFIESASHTRKAESAKDTIRVLNSYCDAVMVRLHKEDVLKEMALHSEIPIINGLSANYHPCQIMADLLTLKEFFGKLKDLTVTYIGDGNNILHSLLMLAPQLGIHLRYCCPSQHLPNIEILQRSQSLLQENKGTIMSFSCIKEAVTDTHAVYTDVWTSMGFDECANEADFIHLQINESIMSLARKNAVFMHCMPMVRGKEVSETLPEQPCSVIFQQSENRLHIQKALLLHYLKEEKEYEV